MKSFQTTGSQLKKVVLVYAIIPASPVTLSTRTQLLQFLLLRVQQRRLTKHSHQNSRVRTLRLLLHRTGVRRRSRCERKQHVMIERLMGFYKIGLVLLGGGESLLLKGRL